MTDFFRRMKNMTKPVVLVVMDGVGETPSELGNMVKQATPWLRSGWDTTSVRRGHG